MPPMFIRKPMTNEELEENQIDFHNIANFLNIIGAVELHTYQDSISR